MYVYIWFDTVGYSADPPTFEDQLSIESGDLMVLELKGTDLPPFDVDTGKEIKPCELDTTPDGAVYHYVP